MAPKKARGGRWPGQREGLKSPALLSRKCPIPSAMTFLWPNMLWLLLLAPLAVGIYIWLINRRKKVTVRFTDLTLLKLAESKHRWRRHVPAALLLTAFVLLA